MKTAILLTNQFIMLNLDLVMDTLRIANRVLDYQQFEWQIFSLDNGPVLSCNGFAITPEADWLNADELDCIMVIAGFEPHQKFSPMLLTWLRQQHQTGAILGCIDTGAFTLAEAGVLQDMPIAIHWEFEAEFRRLYPHLQTNSGGMVCSKQFYSASGGLSVADMMMSLLQQYLTRQQLREVRHILYSHGSTPGGVMESERHAVNDPISRIEKAETHMHATLAHPLSLAQLAARVSMHPRTFARHFQHHYGTTPMRYYRELRLQHAQELLLQTQWPVSKIAELTGFAELGNFSNCFRLWSGQSPAGLRCQHQAKQEVL